MPFQSEKQRRFLHANHPEIAKRWERDYANGGILDINASEEISDDGGNEIELTDYNVAFDDPNDFSNGVKSLFRAKDGGNIRLQPHTATDLLAKKNPDGTRSKYQPPGGGATSLGSGRDAPGSDRGPRDAPDRHGPTQTTTSTTTGGGQDWQQTVGQNYPTTTTTYIDKKPPTGDGDAREKYISEQYKTEYDKYAGTDLEEQQEIDQRDALRRLQSKNISKQERKNLEVGVGIRKPKNKEEKSFLDKLAWGIAVFTGFAPLLGMKVPSFVSTAGSVLSKRGDIKLGVDAYNRMFGTNYSLDEYVDKQVEKFKESIKERKAKMDLYNSLPDGHPEKIALQIELEIGKKPEHLGDGDGEDGPIVDPVTLEVDAEYAQGEDAYLGSNLAAMRAKQALSAQLQQKWAAEQEAYDQLYLGANSGGLANLFRVKN